MTDRLLTGTTRQAVARQPADWSKLERIRYLLDQWELIFDPNTTSPFGTPGDGTGVALLPLMSRHHSVVELERCLHLLFTANPGDYRHVKMFRCGLEHRIVWRTTKVRGPQGKLIDSEPKPERVKIIPPWIRSDRVERGELFLEAKFKGGVDIPPDLYHALTCADPSCRRCWPSMVAA